MDSNGNSINLPQYGFNGISQAFTDNTGNQLTLSGGNYVTNNSGVVTSRNPLVGSYNDPSGNQRTFTVSWVMYPVVRASIWGPGLTPNNLALIDNVQLADGSRYTMTYQPSPTVSGAVTGRLASLTLPTGGTFTYSYGNDPSYGCGLQSSLQRSTPDGSTTYTGTVTTSNTSGCVLNSTTTIANADASSEAVSFITPGVLQGQPASSLKLETAHVWRDAASHTLKSTMRCYNGGSGDCTSQNFTLPITSIKTTTSLDNGQSFQQVSFLNTSGLETELDEYDFSASQPSRRTVTQYATLGNNILNRPSSIVVYDASGSIVKNTTYGYDEVAVSPTTGNNVPGLASVTGSRGNLTTKREWADANNSVVTTFTYDSAGQVVSQQDSRGGVTTNSYDTATDTYLVAHKRPATGSVQHLETYTVDPATGLTLSSTDENNITTFFEYNDPLLRLTKKRSAAGTPLENWEAYLYDSPNQVRVLTDKNTAGDGALVSKTVKDGLNRTSTQVNWAGAEVDFLYNNMGMLLSTTNPYTSGGSGAAGSTKFAYDGLGRKTAETYADGNQKRWSFTGATATFTDEAQHTWVSSMDALGRLSTVQEPGNLLTTYNHDGANNVIGISQTGVNGEAVRNRSYTYDYLSRLITSFNPETGTVCYGQWNGAKCINGYDPNGNLIYKTDARGSQVTFSYDALNRLTDKTYGDGTPGQHFRYDQTSVWMGQQFNTIGRLSQAGTDQDTRYFGSGSRPGCNPQGSANANSNPSTGNPVYCQWTDELYSYDAMGRVNRIGTAPPSEAGWAAHETDVAYDLAGNMVSLRYPDGRVVTQGWDAANHLQNVVFDNWNGQHVGYTYASGFTYTPAGTQTEITLGNGVYTHAPYNNRQQVCQFWVYNGKQVLSDTHYMYGDSSQWCANTPGNNGNLMQSINTINNNKSQGFSYDGLNRLASFSNGDASMQQSFIYDSFGNVKQLGTLSSNLSFDGNNHINSGGYGYDSAGNVTAYNNGVYTSTYAFDAESKLFNLNNGAGYYTYDAKGERIRKDSGGGFTEYQYLNGQPIAEKSADGSWSDYIYANGQKIARADSYDQRIHTSGTQCSNCGWSAVAWDLPITNYPVKPGDILSWRQYQSGTAIGGVGIVFTNGIYTNWNTYDTNGQVMNNLTTSNQWVNRTVALGTAACQQSPCGTISALWVTTEGNTAPGNWDEYFSDIAITSADGTVTSIYARQANVGLSYFATQTANMTNLWPRVERAINGTEAALAQNNTTYYSGDQIGSTRLTTSAAGWPTSSDIFYPFGQEQSAPADPNHYRFTGKERDAESGLDYFGARYYSSVTGRFMSPDWSARAEPIPYATINDPQSLNLYSYVRNNPVTRLDLDGHMESRFSIGGDGWGASDGISNGLVHPMLAAFVSGATEAQQTTDSITVTANSHWWNRVGHWFGGTSVGIGFARFGRLGGPAHRAAVNAASDLLRNEGYIVTQEKYVRTPNGAKQGRFIDTYGEKAGSNGIVTKSFQIGRTNNNGSPVAREVGAMNDIEGAGFARPNFLDYQSPFPMGDAGPIPGWPVQPTIMVNPVVAPEEEIVP